MSRKRKLPSINKGFNGDWSVRKHLAAKKAEADAAKISKEQSGYLCEREIYTPENYDKIKERHQEYIDDSKINWMAGVYRQNKKDFLDEFKKVIAHTGDWISARMVVHSSFTTMELNGVDYFSWADDVMCEYLHQSDMNR